LALLKALMVNPFFKNNGPYKLSEILSLLNLKIDEAHKDFNVIDIKDLQNAKSEEITFFH
jgi:UDP-3-O-[3-hydroxymyristoyl] glucosamine N-acyltransferase